MLYRSSNCSRPRQGVVLVAVLVVVTVLALAAYQYSQLMSSEYRAADGNTRAAQAKAAALSGVHYFAAIGSDPNSFTSTLQGNPYDNSQYFQDILVHDDPNPKNRLHFTILSLRPLDDPLAQSQPYRFGVEDEASKINVNALLQYDKTGTIGLQILQGLPNMTADGANCILDWVDGSSSPRSGGAKDETYMSMSPPYHCKNGPMDTLDEMLLISNMTTDLLYGNDLNFNGQLDSGEVGGSGNTGGVDRGWSPYLTVYSREANVNNSAAARVYINDKSITTLQTNLTTQFSAAPGNSQALINFILAYRIFGGTTTPASTTGAKAVVKALSSSDQQAVLTALNAKITAMSSSSSGSGNLTAIPSLFSLINATVSVPTGSGMNAKTVTMPSPLSDPTQQGTLLPMLLDGCTTSQNPDLAPRINVNTASQTVLMTLVKQTSQSSTTTTTTTTAAPAGLQITDVQAIVANQPTYTSGEAVDPMYSTPAWLITKAGLSPTTVASIEPYITARSTVYRFQVLGYFEGGGPVARLEAVVDTNYGRPRIVYIRNLTDLGKVFDMTQIQLNK